MNELALFSGAGGGILGGKLLGWNTIGAVEIEEYPREALLQKQRDGILEPFPIWDDITTFNGKPWKGCVDIISGGFPCQDISTAGKGAGINGERSGLWSEMARIISEIRPRYTFVENSPVLTSRGLGNVLGDLAEMGYDARWCVLGADDAGAPHRRKRIWILAYTNKGRSHSSSFKKSSDKKRREKQNGSIKKRCQISWWDTDPADIPDADQFNDDICRHGASQIQREQSGQTEVSGCEISDADQDGCNQGREGVTKTRSNRTIRNDRRPTEPIMGRVAYGVANRVDRLKAIGNGQVPAVAAIAFTILSEGIIN